MRILWAPRAIADLRIACDYIATRNPPAAQDLWRRVRGLISLLEHDPHIGRPGRVGPTRELVVTGTRYVVAYRISGDVVRVLRVMHGARRWPARF